MIAKVLTFGLLLTNRWMWSLHVSISSIQNRLYFQCHKVSVFVTKVEYKAEWLGKTILMIGKFELTSKICHVCGYHNSELKLKDREWKCPDCKTKYDRDINAAINIKRFSH